MLEVVKRGAKRVFKEDGEVKKKRERESLQLWWGFRLGGAKRCDVGPIVGKDASLIHKIMNSSDTLLFLLKGC